jgi:hypothetical protein
METQLFDDKKETRNVENATIKIRKNRKGLFEIKQYGKYI